MKIAFLAPFYPFRGGIAQFNSHLYRALEKENEVFAFTFTRQYPGFLFPGNTQFVTPEDSADPIPATRVLDSINPLSYGKTAKAINRKKPDLLIVQYWMTFFGFSLGAVLRKTHKSTQRISVLHNVIPHEKRFFDSFANRLFLKNSDGFVVLSDAVLKDLLSLKPDAKYLRINHPVYAQFGSPMPVQEARQQLNIDPQRKTLLFFGLIRDYKGLDILIEAVALLDDSYQVIVAGECYGDFRVYEKMLTAKGLGDRFFIFNRYIADGEVPLFFSAADVCVLPYRTATQSGVTAVSQHFEIPVIATDVGGLKESVLHGETGLIVARPDSTLLAAQITYYFENQLQKPFSEAIRRQKTTDSWENFAAKLIAFAATLKAEK
jgi:glycosyltransferase involved in cell wall biosynthesis